MFAFCGCGVGEEGDAAAVNDKFQGGEGCGEGGIEPFCAEELATLVEGVDV